MFECPYFTEQEKRVGPKLSPRDDRSDVMLSCLSRCAPDHALLALRIITFSPTATTTHAWTSVRHLGLPTDAIDAQLLDCRYQDILGYKAGSFLELDKKIAPHQPIEHGTILCAVS